MHVMSHLCMCETGCEKSQTLALVFPRGAHVFMCALTCDVCPFIYICIASPLGGEAGPWVCTSLHTLGSSLIYMLVAASVASAALRARAIVVCCVPPLLPPFSHPPNPLVQVLHYGGISLPRLWQDIPSCASNGVWFFGGVCFRLRAI